MSTTLSSPTPPPEAHQEPPKPQPRGLRWWLQRFVSGAAVLAAGVLVIIAMGIAQRVGWISSGVESGQVAGTEAAQIHTCPMHPQIRQPGPGRCPICGMELVPAASAAGADVDELSVKIEPAARRLANIQTAAAERAPIEMVVETVGALAIDESRVATIASYINGRIERLFADYTGVEVAQGDHLAVVYSPELYSAQVEYLETRKSSVSARSSGLDVVREAQQKLAANSRQRLVELGMTDEQISRLEETGEAQSRMTIYAPNGGTVIEKPAIEGMYITAGEPIYRVADLSTIWLMLELFPEDAARIRYGQRVEAEIQSLPGEVFNGRVAFIAPTVDEKKRTVGVRVELLNDEGRLRPGDYAQARIYLPIGDEGEVYDVDLAGRWISPMHPQIIRDEPGQCPICGMDLVPTSRFGYSETPVEQPASLYVPRSAVLMAGANSVVYVETEPGRFEIRHVVLGPILKDKVVILSGIEEGEQVAVAGNFLIDSQMQLAGKPSLIDPTRAIAAQQERKGPLQLEPMPLVEVEGDAGRKLETFYGTYFDIQKSLAADQTPSEESARRLHELSRSLAADPAFDDDARRLLEAIADQSAHLHHLDLAAARQEAFKPISHAVIELAGRIRGADSSPATHFFCPMVAGGGGDWLQSGRLEADELRNPYWGAQMLTCGEQVQVFPASPSEAPAAVEPEHLPDSQ